MKKIIIGAVVLALAIGVFFIYKKMPVPSVPVVADGYKNTTYEIDGRNVTLTNGRAEEEIVPGSDSKLVTQYFGNEVRGDLNADGREDVAFLITQSGGGSGTFYSVVVALGAGDSYIGTNSVFLGDRIAPQTTEIHDGKLVVNYADRAPGEPMTVQPSVGISTYLEVHEGQLVKI